MKKLSEEEFCNLYSAFTGESIIHPWQLRDPKFRGIELRKFVNFCIKRRKYEKANSEDRDELFKANVTGRTT